PLCHPTPYTTLFRSIRIDRRFFKAYSVLSELRASRPDPGRIGPLRALLAEAVDDVDGELHLRHALATELEALGDHDAALAALERSAEHTSQLQSREK